MTDFNTMTRAELRRYILDNRSCETALQVYIDRFGNPNNKVHPAPEALEDLDNFPELQREYLERRRIGG
jgi:hypothetical protein